MREKKKGIGGPHNSDTTTHSYSAPSKNCVVIVWILCTQTVFCFQQHRRSSAGHYTKIAQVTIAVTGASSHCLVHFLSLSDIIMFVDSDDEEWAIQTVPRIQNIQWPETAPIQCQALVIQPVHGPFHPSATTSYLGDARMAVASLVCIRTFSQSVRRCTSMLIFALVL